MGISTMTKEQAKTFSRTSTNNVNILHHTLKCGCQPYQDVFTYNRWKAQGMQVQRGAKAIKLAMIKQIEQDEEIKKIFTSSNVFCRCQVKSSNIKNWRERPIEPATTREPTKMEAPKVEIKDDIMKGFELI